MKCFLDECCCSILHLPSLYILISIFICTSPVAKKIGIHTLVDYDRFLKTTFFYCAF